MSSDSENPGSAYLRLLQHAGLDRFETLEHHEPATLHERIADANRELELFAELPDKKIASHLIDHRDQLKEGEVTIVHLPDKESHLWKESVTYRLPTDAGLPDDDDFPLRPARQKGLAGSDDFKLRDPAGSRK